MSDDRGCSVDGCDRGFLALSYCQMHYHRFRRHGTTDLLPRSKRRKKRTDERERFWSKVAIARPDDCWLWQGRVNNMGYGRFTVYDMGEQRRYFAHRYSLALTGEFDPSLVVMHACDTPRCVNPAHLSQGTQLDNIRDALAKGRMNMAGLELGRKQTAADRHAARKERS